MGPSDLTVLGGPFDKNLVPWEAEARHSGRRRSVRGADWDLEHQPLMRGCTFVPADLSHAGEEPSPGGPVWSSCIDKDVEVIAGVTGQPTEPLPQCPSSR